jgi:aminoglycoside 3-N-acetyltransferase
MLRDDVTALVSDSLNSLGLSAGDTLLVHADITSIVRLCADSDWSNALHILDDAINKQIGPSGNLLVPAFNWDFCIGKPYHDVLTPSRQGIFANYIRKQSESIRSAHPIFSFSGIGPGIRNLFEGISGSSFGQNSVFDRIHKLNVKLIFFNTSFFNCTFVHHIEHMLQVPYRYSKNFSGQVTINGKTYVDTYEFYVRDEKMDVQSFPTRLGDKLLDMQLMSSAKCGDGKIYCVCAQDVYRVAVESINNCPYFLLKNDPTKRELK